jgi:predicted metal-dependent HD superfamily phosphohydrolase
MVGIAAFGRQGMLRAMTEPSYDECLVEAELRARAAYAEPGRHYHDERHLDECLELLNRFPNLDERDRRLLRWAILWHDAIYEPGLTGNEEQSAELAERELAACGVDPADAAEVARLIRLTAKHRADPSDQLGAWLVYIDLAILGSDAERYRTYVQDVRREYAHVPDPLWQTGRAAVLKRILEAAPLYPNLDLSALFEDQARANMADELKSLGEG